MISFILGIIGASFVSFAVTAPVASSKYLAIGAVASLLAFVVVGIETRRDVVGESWRASGAANTIRTIYAGVPAAGLWFLIYIEAVNPNAILAAWLAAVIYTLLAAWFGLNAIVAVIRVLLEWPG